MICAIPFVSCCEMKWPCSDPEDEAAIRAARRGQLLSHGPLSRFLHLYGNIPQRPWDKFRTTFVPWDFVQILTFIRYYTPACMGQISDNFCPMGLCSDSYIPQHPWDKFRTTFVPWAFVQIHTFIRYYTPASMGQNSDNFCPMGLCPYSYIDTLL